ncbi:MAG: hypothetical protein SGJ13_16315 [Actinomycetota bacterium]|nr:hypothetical protein [Actinomycetota bacterium]
MRTIPVGTVDNTLRFENDRYLFYVPMYQMDNGDCHAAIGTWMLK